MLDNVGFPFRVVSSRCWNVRGVVSLGRPNFREDAEVGAGRGRCWVEEVRVVKRVVVRVARGVEAGRRR